jgi:arylsulfatase A-like enzyme
MHEEVEYMRKREAPRSGLFAVLGILAVLTLITSPAAAAKKPNVVVMMVDNLGWGELGVYGGGELRGAPTPHLDKLAREGMRLLNFNVEPQCTPTRSVFMTGRRPIRSGTTKVVWGMLYGLLNWEVTIAKLMSEAGYATGMFGKWHIGDVPGRFPTDQGFDEWYGVANTTDKSEYSSQFQYDPEVGTKPMIVEARKGEVPRDVKPCDTYGYKWRNWKMHPVELENMNSEPRPLNVPRVYNLITDPKEEYNINVEATWVLPVMFKKIVEFQKTFAKEPPISLGTPDPYKPPK